jgi:hypothetical protein
MISGGKKLRLIIMENKKQVIFRCGQNIIADC